MIHFLVQLAAITNFAYAIYWDYYFLKAPQKMSFGGQWKYLTYWNLWIQLIYFCISLLNNIIGTCHKIKKYRDDFFATIAFPIGQFVGIVFWILYHIDREVIFPLVMDDFFPNYINHMRHTSVVPLQLMELCLLHHVYPKNGMFVSALFCFTYLSWTLMVAYLGGIWVYPIFEVLSPVPRAIFMVCSSMFGALLYKSGEYFNTLVWGSNKIKHT